MGGTNTVVKMCSIINTHHSLFLLYFTNIFAQYQTELRTLSISNKFVGSGTIQMLASHQCQLKTLLESCGYVGL